MARSRPKVGYVAVLRNGMVAVYTPDIKPVPQLQGRWVEKEELIRKHWEQGTSFIDHRPRAELLGPNWARLRRQVLSEEPNCRRCAQPTSDVDHIVPLHWGGSAERENLQGLCRPCHEAKTAKENRESEHRTPTIDLGHLKGSDHLPPMLPGVRYELGPGLHVFGQ